MNTNHRLITMSNLGKRGRFGNQVFQYGFLKIYSQHYSLDLQTSPWVGQYLFGHHDPPVTHSLPKLDAGLVREYVNKHSITKAKEPPFINVDLNGQFMVHTKFYNPHKAYFRSLFQPIPQIQDKLNEGMNELRRIGKTIIGIHIRRGDFLKYKNHKIFVSAPTKWYTLWLDQIWPTLIEPVLFVASDDLEGVLPDFKKYNPITSNDIIEDFPIDQSLSYRPNPSFYPDFYILTQCDLLAISNSSFSFAASLLNKKCNTFMRPHPLQKLVPYDPWDSNVKVSFPKKKIPKED